MPCGRVRGGCWSWASSWRRLGGRGPNLSSPTASRAMDWLFDDQLALHPGVGHTDEPQRAAGWGGHPGGDDRALGGDQDRVTRPVQSGPATLTTGSKAARRDRERMGFHAGGLGGGVARPVVRSERPGVRKRIRTPRPLRKSPSLLIAAAENAGARSAELRMSTPALQAGLRGRSSPSASLANRPSATALQHSP
jgi:hypothetical protein